VGVAVGEPVATVGPGVGVDVGYSVGDCQGFGQSHWARTEVGLMPGLTAVGSAVGAAVGIAVGSSVGACGHGTGLSGCTPGVTVRRQDLALVLQMFVPIDRCDPYSSRVTGCPHLGGAVRGRRSRTERGVLGRGGRGLLIE
jgi:hypothetical protein